MKFIKKLLTLLLSVSFVTNVYAAVVDDHAPIGVMSEHIHKKGEYMLSYRYKKMDMPDNYSSTNKISVADVSRDYMIAPVNMTMEMHMIGLMYGVSDSLTAMFMLPYTIKEMEHRRRSDSKQFSTRAQGVGDVRLSGLYSLKEHINLPAILNFGVSFPTGSINRKDDTLAGANSNLPYPMQLGSGTYDFLPGITYLDKHENLSWGMQSMNTVRFGRNEYKYRLGNIYELTSWLAYKWSESLSTSFRAKASKWDQIHGADPRLNPDMVPTADPDKRGGERIDLFLGINLLGHESLFKDHRLALEFGYPVYQNLAGPQLGAGLQGTLGWQKTF